MAHKKKAHSKEKEREAGRKEDRSEKHREAESRGMRKEEKMKKGCRY